MALDKDLLDKLIEEYQEPEDLIGENGLLLPASQVLLPEPGSLQVRSMFSGKIQLPRKFVPMFLK